MNTNEVSQNIPNKSLIDVRLKLSALWIVYMFIYSYTDYYKMYVPGKINEMISGFYGEIQITQMSLFIFSAITIIPALMIFLTLILKEKVNRWSNLIIGALHIVVGGAAIFDSNWTFWIFYCSLLICVATLIVVYAWRWQQDIVK
ncbi:MAG: DUF6326 family protein [Leptospirales bacterium]